MTQNEGFYSSLPLEMVIARLQHVQVNNVSIRVNQADDMTTHFRLELQKRSWMGLTMIYAHLIGTIQPAQNGTVYVAYRTGALSQYIAWIVSPLAIALSVLLWMMLPSQLAIIAGMPAIVGTLFAIFWGIFSNGMYQKDQYRLQELLGRLLEKQSSMARWQG